MLMFLLIYLAGVIVGICVMGLTLKNHEHVVDAFFAVAFWPITAALVVLFIPLVLGILTRSTKAKPRKFSPPMRDVTPKFSRRK